MLTLTNVSRAVQRLDAWRRPLDEPPSAIGSYKEWLHFCVRLPELEHGHLLVNLSFTERALGRVTVCTPRLIVLAHDGEWVGSVEAFGDESASAPAGTLDVRFGSTRVRWVDGAYQLSLHTEHVRGELRLRPATLPTVKSSVSLAPGHAMHWVAVPRLAATGWVQIKKRRFRLNEALAYHDHNWGHFRWGRDLSWEWGFVHPSDPNCPWTVIFVRVSDGQRHRTLSQGALVWKNDSHVRTFQNHELSLRCEGCLVGLRPLTLPGSLGLLVPGAASGVPESLTLTAQGLDDELTLSFEPSSFARIALPSDSDPLGVVLLNETTGRARLRGRTRAGEIELEGSAVVEMVRG